MNAKHYTFSILHFCFPKTYLKQPTSANDTNNTIYGLENRTTATFNDPFCWLFSQFDFIWLRSKWAINIHNFCMFLRTQTSSFPSPHTIIIVSFRYCYKIFFSRYYEIFGHQFIVLLIVRVDVNLKMLKIYFSIQSCFSANKNEAFGFTHSCFAQYSHFTIIIITIVASTAKTTTMAKIWLAPIALAFMSGTTSCCFSYYRCICIARYTRRKNSLLNLKMILNSIINIKIGRHIISRIYFWKSLHKKTLLYFLFFIFCFKLFLIGTY